METNSNYTLTGLFVLVFLVAAIVLSLWIAGDLRRGETTFYTVYMAEPVSGLAENSRVLMQGVPVGRVHSLSLDPSDPRRVKVTLDLAADTPVRADTTAVLRSQGATGLLRLELEGGSPDAGPPPQPEGEPYPVIQSRLSFWARLDDSVDDGMEAVETVARQLNRLLTDENTDALAASIQNLESLTAALARNAEQMDELMASTAGMARQGERIGERVPETIDRLDEALGSFNTLAGQLERTAAEMEGTASAGRVGVESFNRRTLPELEAMLDDLRQASDSLRRLGDQLEDEPQRLILGPPEVEPGPGER
ncbi:MlaD family protein [Gammaproteobacteria bacterium AB-CW1]|uniref:MlaD family protein n=1 Tax=Natronospira elongata TaxID=3110268 RepID=A0AAP6MKS6_9GAMM|nr:MlaD family protein [Gammaproteobacteria bacterium AB-CW1]